MRTTTSLSRSRTGRRPASGCVPAQGKCQGSVQAVIRGCRPGVSAAEGLCACTMRTVQMATILFYLTDVEEGGETGEQLSA